MKVFIAGLVMFFGSLWGGAYFMHLAGNEWWSLPTLMTSVIIGVMGFVAMVVSVEVVRGQG
jgi:hypothetical protein